MAHALTIRDDGGHIGRHASGHHERGGGVAGERRHGGEECLLRPYGTEVTGPVGDDDEIISAGGHPENIGGERAVLAGLGGV